MAGHPVHPALTDLPIGFWTSAWVLDIVGGENHAPTADLLVGIGLLSVVPTAITGALDWRSLPTKDDKRVGLLHAASNVTATALYGLSWLARRNGERKKGVLLGHAAAAAATLGGYLGGELVFSRGAGSASHRAR